MQKGMDWNMDEKLLNKVPKDKKMKYLTPEETIDMLKRLRNGEKVQCPFCENGEFVTKGDYRTSSGFQCNNCKKRWNIN